MSIRHTAFGTLMALATAAALTNTLPGCAPDAGPSSDDVGAANRSNPIERQQGESLARSFASQGQLARTHARPQVPSSDGELAAEFKSAFDGGSAAEFRATANREAVATDGPDDALEPQEDETAGDLSVRQLVAAVGVEGRVPQGVSASFSTEVSAVYAFAKVRNSVARTHITMVWRRDGKVRSRVRLKVGKSSGWRTWSRQRMRRWDLGEWSVDVEDDDGNVLDTLDFYWGKPGGEGNEPSA